MDIKINSNAGTGHQVRISGVSVCDDRGFLGPYNNFKQGKGREGMLILTRKVGESFRIGDDIVVTIIGHGYTTRIGIDAPKDVPIVRTELDERDREKARAGE